MIRVFSYFLYLLTAVALLAADPNDGALSLAVVTVMSGIALAVFRRSTDEKEFITQIFLSALCVRLLFGITLHVYGLRDFVGPDSQTFDLAGGRIADYWRGLIPTDWSLKELLSIRSAGWGMNYLAGALYFLFGKSILVGQSFCGVIGAAIAPLIYFCAERIFHNKSVSRTAAFTTAFFPAFVIWSSQFLKDGLVVFLLVLAMTMILEIQRKLSVPGILALIFSLVGILSLRFYIFYMVTAAVVGSFVIGVNTSMKAIVQRTAIILIVGLALTYVGVVRVASVNLDYYGSLERVQLNRSWLTQSESAYATENDVSTVGGALSQMPTGFAYLLFAPFPWEMKNLRQTLTLPDVLLWWAMWPLVIYGLWYTLRHRLRAAFPVLVFTLMLTISYSVFQGNVGAAYRQRTQIQVFLFLFVAVGWSLFKERRADKKLVEMNRKRTLDQQLRARLHAVR